ncbi:MAG TPA: hypothetical protein VL100_07250 [Croceibacterium sp.]|nr:hypothetical protein [Croceibacterium sp.]
MANVPVTAIRARHRVADYFLSRDAVSINQAVRFTTRSPVERRAFERMRDKGFIRAAGNDAWFLDLGAYDRARRRRTGLVVAAGAALGAGLAAALIRRRN